MTVSRETLRKLRAKLEGQLHQADAPILLLIARIERVSRKLHATAQDQ